MKKDEKMLRALSEIDDSFIDEANATRRGAKKTPRKKQSKQRRYAYLTLAACLAFLTLLPLIFSLSNQQKPTPPTPNTSIERTPAITQAMSTQPISTQPISTQPTPEIPDEVTFSMSFSEPDFDDTIAYASLLVDATFEGSYTGFVSMFGYEIEVFYDRYTVTEVLYGECAESTVVIKYMPYDHITIDTSVGYYPADYARQVNRTVGKNYLLPLYSYANEWEYSDHRIVIPSDDPSTTKIDNFPMTEGNCKVSLSDINTKEKFLQYALSFIHTKGDYVS